MYPGIPKSYDESALVFRLSMLEPHIQHLRERWTQDGAQGVPPHITLLHPFLPAKAWTESASQSLEALVSASPPVNVEFRDISWLSAGGVLCLRPEPLEAILRVIQALTAAFPECPPYGGAISISSLVPHVTIAVDVRAEDRADVEREAQRRLGASLPIKVRLDNLPPDPKGRCMDVRTRLPVPGGMTPEGAQKSPIDMPRNRPPGARTGGSRRSDRGAEF